MSSVEEYLQTGLEFQQAGKMAEAISCYRNALAVDPNSAWGHFHLGVTLQRTGQGAAATECYRHALRLRPDFAEAYANLGTIYKSQQRLAEAIACYDKALEFQPNFAEVLNNLGNVFKTQGRLVDARVCYEQALRIKPDDSQARHNWSLMALAAGDFATGWAEYEWRWQCPDFPRRDFSQPRWRGEPVGDRVLLVHCEQGLGDTLQFIRYLPLVKRNIANVVVEVPPPLTKLLTISDFGPLVVQGDELPPFDLHVPLLSLPGIFGTTGANIPSAVPYLAADERLVDHWRGILGTTVAFRVGIAWQGRPSHPGDRFRSIPLHNFTALAQQEVELISLQKGVGREQLAALAGHLQVRDLGPDVDEAHGAFMDTTAILSCLDLVVTSDTSIAHLAGALGVAVWVALPVAPDWRWQLGRADSPWYPTMRLFRQREFGDWQNVFAEMAVELRRAVDARGREPR